MCDLLSWNSTSGGILFQIDGDVAWCDSCHTIVGATSFNEDKTYCVVHEICPNCVIAIINGYDKNRKTGEELKTKPDPVVEKPHHILRTNLESLHEWKVCNHCGRLWKDNIRIVIPIGKCKRCIKKPQTTTIFEWYKKL